MAWNQIATVNEPSPGLGLDEAALADALTWARGRADELLAALDDAELRALLEPPPRRVAKPLELTELVAPEAVEPSDGESIPPPPPYASVPASQPAPPPRRARTTPPPSSSSLSPVERSGRLAMRLERRDPSRRSCRARLRAAPPRSR